MRLSNERSFLERNVDHIVALGGFGTLGASYVAPNLQRYLSEGHERSLEMAVAQGVMTAFGIGVYYAVRHYSRLHSFRSQNPVQ